MRDFIFISRAQRFITKNFNAINEGSRCQQGLFQLRGVIVYLYVYCYPDGVST